MPDLLCGKLLEYAKYVCIRKIIITPWFVLKNINISQAEEIFDGNLNKSARMQSG
jgi:hypothetical protein